MSKGLFGADGMRARTHIPGIVRTIRRLDDALTHKAANCPVKAIILKGPSARDTTMMPGRAVQDSVLFDQTAAFTGAIDPGS